ncbi:MAG: Ribosomal subunit interface protein [Bacteriovoracaceae bacterium]|nr:Ribosomal subunit interface protein [Bacteriovoracaceae bacterium]
MNLEIVYREIDSTEAIKNHIEEKSEKLEKYLKADENIRVVVGTEAKGKIHFAEVYWHDHSKAKDFFARKEGDYLYTQIDEIFDTILLQVQKSHAKIVNNRRHKKTPLKKTSAGS